VRDLRDLLACPACRGALSSQWMCAACELTFEAADGILNLRLPSDARTEAVRRFYDRAPFPGYPPRDSLSMLRARAERSRFAVLLDRAIPCGACVVEIGCGTGQMSLYLARTDRFIVAADLSRSSLAAGSEAARRYGIAQVQFVETDLRRPGLKAGMFDVVYSSGVLHHTPDPRASFAAISRLARPGGMVIVGVYNTVARLPVKLRRSVARLTGLAPIDPVLDDRRQEPARYQAWLRDQYCHPEEHCHTIAEVRGWFLENGVDYLRSFPSTIFGDESTDLFAPAEDDWTVENWLAQVGWIWTLGREGGLFFTIGRRR